ncbi:myocardin-related transcription factor A-like isoform X3 [Pungitius pungitius]|uniref:myocardin-related transcription factor A-like isoform X3 n=1 Tax=Pungitius pungitius TaxID=134920 RepID=UPI002E1672BC
METEIGEIPNAAAFIPSPQSEAVANELQELSLQPASNTLQVRERKDVLQLKLQQRRSREELVDQGIMPPLKSSAAFHEQRRSLERARTEDYLKRKIRARPKRSELIRMHILEGKHHVHSPVHLIPLKRLPTNNAPLSCRCVLPETSAEPSLQAKQLQLKRARIADDLNDKISHRPGPMELIHKNILPVHSSMKRVIIETRFPKASGDTSSCDEDSNYSLSPEGPGYLDSPLGLLPLPSPPETPACSSTPSPTQVSPPALPLAPISFKLSGGTAASSAQRTSQIKPKTSSDRSAQRLKKPKDNKPKIKKLKYHQYIPPDQKGDIEPPPHLDSSYAKILHQQQLFLQLQILSQQQQQHYNYHTILPAPPKAQTDQQPSSSSSFNSTTSSSPPRPVAASSKVPSNHGGHICQSSAALRGTKPVSLPPNLEEMKVAELKSELKLRSLPVSGTKNDLIERLRTYQELIGGSDSTSSPAAGGTTEPGAEGAGRSSRNTAETTNNTPQPQQQFQCLQTSSQTGGSAATPRQLTMTCGGTTSPPTASITHPECSPGVTSPENTSFNGDPLEEMMSSQLSRASLQPRSAARLTASIKEESNGADQAPCQFSSKQASREHHCLVSSTAVTMTTTAPVGPVDKDRMLQEKDKRIEELTRMLRQKQRLVEVLRMQLDHGKRGGTEPLVLVRVKHEPPDRPDVPQSFGPQPISSPPSSAPCEMDAIKVAVKQEAVEAEEDARETSAQLPEIYGLPRPLTQTPEGLERAQLQIQPEQTSAQTKQQHVRLQQTSLQLAQQQAIQQLLLQQQRSFPNGQKVNNQKPIHMQENLQKLTQQRKKKSHKQHLKQLQLQQQQQQQPLPLHQQSKQHNQLKQQILLKQQRSLLQQQQTKQLQEIQVQTKIQLKQQQVLMQQKQQAQQQVLVVFGQVTQASFNQQSGSGPSFPLDLVKDNSTPTLVTDSNGNHFLVALTSHITDNQRTDAPGNKATNHIALQQLRPIPARLHDHIPFNQTKHSTHKGLLTQQEATRQNGGLPGSQPQRDVALCLSAPPSLRPFFEDQDAAPSSPSSPTDLCPSLDDLFSPLSAASSETAASSPDDKDTEQEEDFIDIILQTGEMSTPFNPTPAPSHDRPNPPSSSSSPHPSPSQLTLFPPIPSLCDTPQSASSLESDLQTLADTVTEKQHLSRAESGRLEDFLESTTGKPLSGAEPGGLLTLIDDLHSQMLCTPSILDHVLSPMDTFDLATVGEHGLDGMDWLDLTMGGEREEETSMLAPLGPQTPASVFSTDFLDGSDLPIHWDSCL